MLWSSVWLRYFLPALWPIATLAEQFRAVTKLPGSRVLRQGWKGEYHVSSSVHCIPG